MVSQLFSGLSSLGLSTGQEHYVEDTTLAVPLSTQVYKWVPANIMLGVTCKGLASQPGGVEILPVGSCYRNWDKLPPDGPLGLTPDLTFLFNCKDTQVLTLY